MDQALVRGHSSAIGSAEGLRGIGYGSGRHRKGRDAKGLTFAQPWTS